MQTRRMGEPYERELERVRRARGNFETSQDEVERRKQEYFTAVRTLHEAGMPLREIASALGLSHQRVHQMVDEAIGKKGAAFRRKAGRAAKQGGLAVLMVLLTATGFFTLRPDLSPLGDHPDVHTSISLAPSPSQSAYPKRQDRHQLRFSCARRIFDAIDGTELGEVPEVFIAACDGLSIERRVRGLEARLKRQLRGMTITIRERA